ICLARDNILPARLKSSTRSAMLSERTSATTASRPAFTRASDNFGLSLETSAALPGSTVRRWYKSHALEPGGSTRRVGAIASSTLKINGDGAAALLVVLSGTAIAGGAGGVLSGH